MALLPRIPRNYAVVLTVLAACLLAGVHAEKHAASIASMSLEELEHKLNVRGNSGVTLRAYILIVI